MVVDPHKHGLQPYGCGAVLFADAIPVSEVARQMNDGRSPLDHALSDGEDFELAFAVSAEDGQRLLDAQPIPGLCLARVGVFTLAKDYLLEEDGARRPLAPRGYVHPFGPA